MTPAYDSPTELDSANHQLDGAGDSAERELDDLLSKALGVTPTSFHSEDVEKTETDFASLVQSIEVQSLRCEAERAAFRRYLKIPSVIFGTAFAAGLICLLVFTTWSWWYLLLVYPCMGVVLFLEAVFSENKDTMTAWSTRLAAEERVLSKLLELAREIGPSLAHEKKISPLKWAVIRIQLSRYGI